MTSDEAWGHLGPNRAKPGSIHLEEWPSDRYGEWYDASLNEKWASLAAVREEVLKKLEEKRQAGDIGSSLEAHVTLTVSDEKLAAVLAETKEYLRYIFIVSGVEVAGGAPGNAGAAPLAIAIRKAEGAKCERCWNYSVKVGSFEGHPTLCERCAVAVA
jgi:isoleucyl-tRNA synthetase